MNAWRDNLDVLGLPAYQARPGPHLDASMHSDWKATALLSLHLEKSVPRVLWLARGYDFLGYPIAAQSLRDRAMSLTVALDPHLPANEAPLVRWTLQTETRPLSLTMAAQVYERSGFELTGAAFRDRSSLLQVAARPRRLAPEIVAPWTSPPAPAVTAAERHFFDVATDGTRFWKPAFKQAILDHLVGWTVAALSPHDLDVVQLVPRRLSSEVSAKYWAELYAATGRVVLACRHIMTAVEPKVLRHAEPGEEGSWADRNGDYAVLLDAQVPPRVLTV